VKVAQCLIKLRQKLGVVLFSLTVEVIWAVLIVCRIWGQIISTVLRCLVYHNCMHNHKQTQTSNHLVLELPLPLQIIYQNISTTCLFICLFLCLSVRGQIRRLISRKLWIFSTPLSFNAFAQGEDSASVWWTDGRTDMLTICWRPAKIAKMTQTP